MITAAGCGASGRLSDDRRKELSGRWQLYVRDDPKWPAAREQWLSGPESERQLLLDNLLRQVIADDNAARGEGSSGYATRARQELKWFGAEPIPLLVEGMRGLAARDRVDVIALDRIGSALTELQAVSALAEMAGTPGGSESSEASVKLRLAAVRALQPIPDPAVTKVLLERVKGDAAWSVRGAAVDALRSREQEPGVHAALVAALDDPDGYVRGEAIGALATGLDPQTNAGAFERLIRILVGDRDATARKAAAEVLALHASEPAIGAALLHALRDPDMAVAMKAAFALMYVGSGEVRRGLIDLLDRAVATRDIGPMSELPMILKKNFGEAPPKLDADSWRKLLEQVEAKR